MIKPEKTLNIPPNPKFFRKFPKTLKICRRASLDAWGLRRTGRFSKIFDDRGIFG